MERTEPKDGFGIAEITPAQRDEIIAKHVGNLTDDGRGMVRSWSGMTGKRITMGDLVNRLRNFHLLLKLEGTFDWWNVQLPYEDPAAAVPATPVATAPAIPKRTAEENYQRRLDQAKADCRKKDSAQTRHKVRVTEEAVRAWARCREGEASWKAAIEDKDERAAVIEKLNGTLKFAKFPLPHSLLIKHGKRERAAVVWLAKMLRWFGRSNGKHWKSSIYKTAVEASAETGLTVDQCIEAARKAVSLGWVAVTRKYVRGGKHPANHYSLTDLWTLDNGLLRLKDTPHPDFWGNKRTVWHQPNWARMMSLPAAHLLALVNWRQAADVKQLASKDRRQDLDSETIKANNIDAEKKVCTDGLRLTKAELCERLGFSARMLRDARACVAAHGYQITLKGRGGRSRTHLVRSGPLRSMGPRYLTPIPRQYLPDVK